FSACVFTFLPLNGDDWSTNPSASGTLGNIFSAHIEFVSRREIVERWVPLRSRIKFICQHKLAARAWHNQWLRPRLEFGVMNNLKNPANTEIVIANSSRVPRILFQFVCCRP